MVKRDRTAPATPGTRKIQSATPKKASPLKAAKPQPIGIDLNPPAPAAGRGRKKGAAPGPDGAAGGGRPAVAGLVAHDQIAARAYLIWEAKGRPQGQDEANWREAEEQLRREASQLA